MMKKTTTKNTAAAQRPVADEKSDYVRALDSLTRYLALRDHSKLELKTRLGRKYPAELVDRLLNDAENSGWLPQEDQLAQQIALTLARKHKSQAYIESQLRARGLPVKDGGPELDNARYLVERKFGPSPLTSENQKIAYRFLKYRGFEDRVIHQVLNEE
jgi:SOS response regulatory protein OraA/RecX